MVEDRSAELPNPGRTGMMLDDLAQLIHGLDQNRELQAVFGNPVSAALAIVADRSDLRIEDAGIKELNPDQQQVFLRVLEETIAKRGSQSGDLAGFSEGVVT